MKITALIENDSFVNNLFEQYGLSLFLQTENGNVVIDAGQDDKALLNFHALGYRDEEIDAIVISHNHYDHIGGLQFFADSTFALNVPIYMSADCDRDLYTKSFFGRRKLVSCNELVQANSSRIVRVEDCAEVIPSVYACRVAKVDRGFVCKDKKLKMMGADRKLCSDDFTHEIYLAVIENKTVKIISSCSHNGIVNIVRDAKERFSLPITAFVGGLHMRGKHSSTLNASKAYFGNIIEELNKLEIGTIYTCHCTGAAGFELLKKDYKSRAIYFNTADSFVV